MTGVCPCGHDERIHLNGMCGAMHCYCTRDFTPNSEPEQVERAPYEMDARGENDRSL